MNNGKRILAAVTALCVAAGLAGGSAGNINIWKVHAERAGYENTQGAGLSAYRDRPSLLSSPASDFQYEELADNTIKITKYIGTDDIVEIPADIGGKSVSAVGSSAFDKCNSVTQLVIPAAVSSIETNAIVRCPSLTEISVDTGNQNFSSVDGVLFNKAQTELIRYPEGKAGAYVIPDGVADIGKNACLRCDGLTEVTIPSSVKNIGDSAFWLCSNLTQVHMAEGVEVIKSGAFTACTKLAGITLPGSLTAIETHAFENCPGLTEITIPDGITDLRGYTFSDCTGLTTVTLPDSVTGIEDHVFANCTALADVHYSGTREQWAQVAVGRNGNDALQNAQFHYEEAPDLTADYEYEDLGDGTAAIVAYKGTDTDVVIPAVLDGKSVVRLKEAFLSAGGVQTVTIPSSVTAIDRDAFMQCPSLTDISVDSACSSYASQDGVLFNKDKTTLIRCPEGRSGVYTIPSGVSRIGDAAFRTCESLTEIVVKDGVREIGISAFSQCSALTHMTLPQGIMEIGDAAFQLCGRLAEINIPKSVKIIKDSTFLYCRSLPDIELPEGVVQVEAQAFLSCDQLKSITIPESMQNISNLAFATADVPSSLEDVYYNGTQEQWEQIGVEGDGSTLKEKLGLNAVIHFKETPDETPDHDINPSVGDAKQELSDLKSDDSLLLEPDFAHYMSAEQINTVESGLYTWLAQIDYAYRYSDSSSIKELIMKKAGINPEGDFASGTEQAVTHISVETQYGPKVFEITLDLGKPDGSGSLYPAFGAMRYEVLDKTGIPSGVPTSGQIGKAPYTNMKPFIESVFRADDDSLHTTYQWKSLDDERTACILIDKTAAEIIGNKNGSFSDGTFTVYGKPLVSYKKIVTISGEADVYVYSMDGKEAGSIVNNQPVVQTIRTNPNVQMSVNGDTKTVYLAGDDYYLKMRGTDAGTMTYEVEEVANDDVRRKVQFLELQLLEDMQYDGYVFRPLNIDSDLYALRVQGGSTQDMVYPGTDTYQSLFKRVEDLSLSQSSTSLDTSHTVQLNAILSPMDASNPNLQWKTDNSSVVTVDRNGLVTAVGSGRATITVATKDGSFLRQFCVIDVAGGSNGGLGSNGGPGSSGGNGSTGDTGSNGGLGSNGNTGSNGGTGGGNSNPVVVKLHFVLQFDVNGGTELTRKKMTLLTDDSPGILPKARRKDYLFDGWYTQQEGGTQIAADQPLNKAVTLYAHWTKAAAPQAPVQELKSKKKGQLQVSIQKVSGAAGYQVEISTDKSFTSVKTKKIGAAARAKTFTGLKAGKKYFVRVRAYRLDSARSRVYGTYSGIKSIKIKG